MSNQDSTVNIKNEVENDIIITALEKRAKSARITMLIFVYLIFIAMLLIFTSVMIMKSKNDNPIKTFVNTMYPTSDVDTSIPVNEENLLNPSKPHKNHVSQDEFDNIIRTLVINSYRFKKSTSQELAESVASIVISLTLLILVGFVMRVSIMFIKYHMQIGNDYDNQKIAYLLSKGDMGVFEKTLISLRTHNITFEKTPNLPQEKIINSLINALNVANKKS